VCLVASSLVAPTHSLAARLTPELKVETRYDDNVLRESEKLRDVVTALTPMLRFTADQPRWTWDVSARRTFASYGRDPAPVVLSDRLTGRTLYQASERESLALNLQYADVLDPFEFEDGLLQQRDSRRATGHARLALEHFEAGYSGRGWWYDDPTLRDGVAQSLGARFVPLRTRTTSLSIGHRRQMLELDSRGLDVDVTTIGARRQHARWLSSEIELGRSETRYDDGQATDVGPAFAFGVQMERGMRSNPIEMQLRLGHDATTTVSASLERRSETGHVRASVERLLDVEGGLYRNPSVVRRAALEWTLTNLDARTLTLRGVYGRVRPFHGTGTTANVLRLTAALETPLSARLGLRTSYDFWKQNVPGEGLDVDFDRHRVAVALTALLGPR